MLLVVVVAFTIATVVAWKNDDHCVQTMRSPTHWACSQCFICGFHTELSNKKCKISKFWTCLSIANSTLLWNTTHFVLVSSLILLNKLLVQFRGICSKTMRNVLNYVVPCFTLHWYHSKCDMNTRCFRISYVKLGSILFRPNFFWPCRFIWA